MEAIPKEQRETFDVHFSEGDDVIKTLGLLWNPETDNFKISVSNKLPVVWTKRTVLSFIARVFDPLGLIGPIVTAFKIFMQQLWVAKVDWDTELTAELTTGWNKLLSHISEISNIRISRCIKTQSTVSHIELHGFADASQRCYGAVLYIRHVYYNSSVSV